ncbi:MAG: PaaI family thioesterase, partial [Pseudomonadota bacterium]|nr:PaaI family thioesterase [Pseudomonadota bacterium]
MPPAFDAGHVTQRNALLRGIAFGGRFTERVKQFEAQTERSGMAANLGYDIVSINDGEVVYRYTPKARHQNLIGSLHGGILASLLDTAMGAAVMTKLAAGEFHTMTDLSIKFIGAVRDPDEELLIEARVDHPGKRLLATEGVIKNTQGRIIAR